MKITRGVLTFETYCIYIIHRYYLHRNNRTEKGGGGVFVFVYVSSKIQSMITKQRNTEPLHEPLALKVCFNSKNAIYSSDYITGKA